MKLSDVLNGLLFVLVVVAFFLLLVLAGAFHGRFGL